MKNKFQKYLGEVNKNSKVTIFIPDYITDRIEPQTKEDLIISLKLPPSINIDKSSIKLRNSNGNAQFNLIGFKQDLQKWLNKNYNGDVNFFMI